MKTFISFIKKAAPLTIAVGILMAVPQATLALNTDEALCKGSGGTYIDGKCLNEEDTDPTVMGTIKNVTNVLLFIAGAIGVIMVIIGGIRYATSAGDQAAITGAKNTVLYALVGVIVTILAYAVVNFVTTNVK